MNNKKILTIIISILFIFLFGILYMYKFSNNNQKLVVSTELPDRQLNETLLEEIEIDSEDIGSIYVYITGEVANPDVYEIDSDSRITDLIEAAGGFTAEADTANVNLAQRLYDEQHVHVFKIGESDEIGADMNVNTNQSSDGKININTADKQQLATLPSIGDTIAQNIIDYREAQGKFKSVEELKNVNRIGDKTFEKIKDLIIVK